MTRNKWVSIANKDGGSFTRALVIKKKILGDIVELSIRYHITQDEKIWLQRE